MFYVKIQSGATKEAVDRPEVSHLCGQIRKTMQTGHIQTNQWAINSWIFRCPQGLGVFWAKN